MSIAITKARVGDSVAIRALENKVWHEQDVTGKYDMATTIRFGYSFVAKDKDKIVGAILAIKTADDEVYVQDWFVNERYRGQGIGKKLYARLIEAVRGLPIVSFLHPDSKESIKAHKQLGFKVVKRIKDVYGLGDSVSRFFVRRAGSRR